MIFEVIDYSGMPVALSIETWQTKAGNGVPGYLLERTVVMAENGKQRRLISAAYDPQSDILTFTFTTTPQPALAEEAADDIWVRYDTKTHEVITVDVLNFSSRVTAAFGPALIYNERTTPDRL